MFVIVVYGLGWCAYQCCCGAYLDEELKLRFSKSGHSLPDISPQWEINEPLQEAVVIVIAPVAAAAVPFGGGLLYRRSGWPTKKSSTVEMAAAAAQTK